MNAAPVTRLLHFLAFGALAFVAGAGTAIYRGWGSPVVYMDVVNNSGAELRSVMLEYESCGARQQLLGGSLHPNERSRFNFLACGEAGYKLSLVLADGSSMSSEEGYAESGYRLTEIVEPRRVRTEMETYHF